METPLIPVKPLHPSPRQGWQGKAQLTYAQRDQGCVPVGSFTQAPLKVQRPLYPEGPEVCHSVLVHTAGGMVGGDLLDIQVALQPQCHTLITTAAANKIYGAGSDSALTQQRVDITLAPGSSLEWFPQDTIVFNAAHYRQTTRIDLAQDALWCGWDITRFGRSARGERFDQGQWRSHLEVWQEGTPLWIDRQQLTGGSAALDSLNGLAGHAVVGTFALVGQLPDRDQIVALRKLWFDHDRPGEVGVTRLQQGLLCRYRGPSSEEARRWFIAAWQYLRPWYLDRPAVVSRVWHR